MSSGVMGGWSLFLLTLVLLLLNGPCIPEHMCIMYVFNSASFVFGQVFSPVSQPVNQSDIYAASQPVSQIASLFKCVSYQPSFLSLRVSHVVRPTAEQQLGIPIRVASPEHSLFL